MRDEMLEKRIRHAMDAELSGLTLTRSRRGEICENAIGGTKVKRKLTVGLAFAIVLMLIAVTALAVALLSPQEVVEQVAVPMAQGNDREWRVEMDFSPAELAAFIRACNENGIDLDENHAIMQAIRNGEGYDEEEAIMAVCRVAFGGNYAEWTIAERHWFRGVMVEIGWAEENCEVLPGPDDLTEEEARSRMLAAIRAEYGEGLPLEDREQFEVIITYHADPSTEGAECDVWGLNCEPRDRRSGAAYYARLNKAGEVVSVTSVPMTDPAAGEEPAPVFTLTEDEAIRLAADAIRREYRVDTPLDDPAFYRWFVNPSRSGEAVWSINFISLTVNGGFCSTRVNDATGEVTVLSADVSDITADNILARYRAAHGWYDEWDTAVWAEVAEQAAGLPAASMEGRVVKATPWIAWREGLLTRDEAEEKAFRQAGVKMGDVNCACLIDAAPNPIWKFRILPWDESWQDSIVVEIDAVTGEMTDLDLYKSDHQELEPSFHMVTLHRIWARLELEENGPLYLARMAVLKRYADMTFDMPEVDSLPIFDLRYWQPEISGNVVRFRSRWRDLHDYEVELDGNGVPLRVEELPSGGTEAMPEALRLESRDELLYDIDPRAMAEAQETYGLNNVLWPLEIQAQVYTAQGRTVPREGEMSLEEAIAFAHGSLPPEAVVAEDAPVGARLYRVDDGLPGEFTRWTIYFYETPAADTAWRVTFVDKHPDGTEYPVDVKGPGDDGNG